MATFTATAQSTPGRVTFYFTSLQYPANEYSFEVDVYWNDIYQRSVTWIGTGTGSASYTSEDFPHGMTLRFEGYATRKGVAYYVGTSTVTTSGSAVPIPSTPSYLSVSNVSATGFNIDWGSSTNAEDYYIYFNNVLITITRHPNTSLRVTRSLEIGVTYSVCVSASNVTGESSKRCSAVLATPNRPASWAWEYNIYSGGPFYSQSGKTAYLMRAAHWNEFTARINAFREYKGYSTYWFSTATSSLSPAELRVCVSQAVIAINEMLPTGKMPSVGTGTTIAASIFINMRDKLNSIS